MLQPQASTLGADNKYIYPNPLLLRKSGRAGKANTGISGFLARNSDHPRKSILIVLQIEKAKDLSAPLRTV
jgi:uncharacterized protein YggU (UPF0235/DUF167 family)